MDVYDELSGQAAAYVLGALTAAERQAFEGHLAGCVACEAEVRSFVPVAAALAHLPAPSTPDAAVRVSVLRAVAAQRRDSSPAS